MLERASGDFLQGEPRVQDSGVGARLARRSRRSRGGGDSGYGSTFPNVHVAHLPSHPGPPPILRPQPPAIGQCDRRRGRTHVRHADDVRSRGGGHRRPARCGASQDESAAPAQPDRAVGRDRTCRYGAWRFEVSLPGATTIVRAGNRRPGDAPLHSAVAARQEQRRRSEGERFLLALVPSATLRLSRRRSSLHRILRSRGARGLCSRSRGGRGCGFAR